MRRDETLREYANRYFESRNTLEGVKDEDVFAYYKKGITNIKLFEKIHEADAHTIGDLMAYVDKLVDTQDTVMHDFNGEDHGDGGTRSRKRSSEAYVADPPRPSENRLSPRRPGATTTTTGTEANISTTVTADLINEITVTAGPILATMTGIDVIIAATTTAMTDATTTVAMTATTGVMITGVISVVIATMTSATTDEMTDTMLDVARTTTITTTTTGRNKLHHHRLKGATPMACFRRPTARSTSTSRPRSNAREIGHVNTENPRPLCWSEFPITFSRKDHWVHILTPGLTRWSLTP
jgi:hypothetical protein